MIVGVGAEKGVVKEEGGGGEGRGGEEEGRDMRVTGMEEAGRPRVMSRT